MKTISEIEKLFASCKDKFERKLLLLDFENEIVFRKHLISTLVGSLYPSIVWDEIGKINDLIKIIKAEQLLRIENAKSLK